MPISRAPWKLKQFFNNNQHHQLQNGTYERQVVPQTFIICSLPLSELSILPLFVSHGRYFTYLMETRKYTAFVRCRYSCRKVRIVRLCSYRIFSCNICDLVIKRSRSIFFLQFTRTLVVLTGRVRLK